MNRVFAACATALYLPFATAQAPSHGHAGGPSQARPPAKSGASTGAYRSPFLDYRAYKPDEPMKDWRKANDEVREAGGHVGLMKGEPAQAGGHGAHGSRQPTPPAQEKK